MLHGVEREEGATDRRSESAIQPIPQEYVLHIRIKLGHCLTCGTDYAVLETDGPEEIFRMVLELSDNVPDKADLLDNCRAGLFRNVLRKTNKKEDIDNCILAYESAVHLTPPGHSDMPYWLSKLGSAYQHRFVCTGDFADISDAISHQQRAVHLTSEGHADMPYQLNNLGNSFSGRFSHTGDLADISDAISHQQRAVHLTPEGHAGMPGWLNNLGISLQYCFKHTGDLVDIFDAISHQQRAVHLTPEGHANMPDFLYNLGISFRCRFEHTGELSDIHTLLSIDRRCATYSLGPPSRRLMSAIRLGWAQQHSSYDPPQSLEAYITAIQLVSQMAGLEQTI